MQRNLKLVEKAVKKERQDDPANTGETLNEAATPTAKQETPGPGPGPASGPASGPVSGPASGPVGAGESEDKYQPSQDMKDMLKRYNIKLSLSSV